MESNHRLGVQPIRSMLLLVIFTAAAWYFYGRGFYPPHGNPFLYAISISWLIAFAIAILASALFQARPKLFSLAAWEREGDIYDRTGIRAFRWILLHSPLGWINPAINLRAGRSDCERLLRETSSAEGVHWFTLVLSSILAIAWIFDGYTVYGYVMLLIRVPFDIYPIMLQRRIRGRVYRVMHRSLA